MKSHTHVARTYTSDGTGAPAIAHAARSTEQPSALDAGEYSLIQLEAHSYVRTSEYSIVRKAVHDKRKRSSFCNTRHDADAAARHDEASGVADNDGHRATQASTQPANFSSIRTFPTLILG